MTLDYGKEQVLSPPVSRRRIVAKVVISVLLAGLLALSSLVGMSVNASYAPYNMTRAQFEAAASFGPWHGEAEYAERSFVLETPEATITGVDTRAKAASAWGPFGHVHLKASAIAVNLMIAAAVPAVLVWGAPWLISLTRMHLRLRWARYRCRAN